MEPDTSEINLKAKKEKSSKYFFSLKISVMYGVDKGRFTVVSM